MAEDRPAKRTVRRDIWLEVIRRRASNRPDDVPLYVTLAGAEGLDIDLLVNEGIVKVTETGAIADTSQRAIVAIESNSDARSRLLHKRPGLEVLPEKFENLLRGTSRIRYPEGRHISVFRPLVLNLDLNDPLLLVLDENSLQCPLVESLVKVATMQRDGPHDQGWSLLLTLHGAIVVTDAAAREAICIELAQVMAHNFSASEKYASRFEKFFGLRPGAGWFEALCTLRGEEDDPSTEGLRQKAMLLLVPKLIVDRSASMGWAINVASSAYYGGGGDAPMVTWAIDFAPTTAAGASARIAASLASVGDVALAIDDDGKSEPVE